MSEYKFVQIDNNSDSAIKELLFRSSKTVVSLQLLKDKYDTSFFGLRNIGFLAIHESNDLAAYYGVFPMRMTIDGKDYLVAQSGDTMTAPEHQKKGLFTDLAKLTYKLAEEKGIQMIFGFPNKNSLPGFQKKLDWKFFGCMQNFIIKNNTVPLCEFSAKYKTFSPLYLNYCNSRLRKYKIAPIDENIRIFNEGMSRGYIKKDADFFKYKLKNKNNFLIKINDFTILIKTSPHLYIGAVGNFKKERTNEFLGTLKQLARKLGCKKTSLSLSENHWLFDHLKSEIDHTEGYPIGYFYTTQQDFPYADISYTVCDSDTF
jgi:hypothetical protein